MNKVRLHFTWEHGIEAEPEIVLINVDLLKADTSLTGEDEAIRQRLLSVIDDTNDYVESTLINDIYKAQDEGEFDLSKYTVNDDIRCITLESWKEP